MKTIHINTSRKYDVLIDKGILSSAGKLIREKTQAIKAALITDENVASLYGAALSASLEENGFEVFRFIFKPGEESKSADTLFEILEFMADSELTRSDLLIALGGGVTGDIGGFAASCYLRGIDYVQIPTTLLAAVDSSVGGKTAVNLKAGKNLAGSFYQPILVICDTELFKTLPKEVFSDGIAEVIKYGVIADKELFALLDEGNIEKHITSVAQRCVYIKAQIVSGDEYDVGQRQLLNFGHTIGHAVEKCSNFAVSHGSAVSIGMVMETGGREIAKQIERVCGRYGLPVQTEFSAQALAAVILNDKKRSGDTLSVIVPKEIGKCEIQSIGIDQIEKYVLGGCK